MACTMFIDVEALEAAKALTAVEQPRLAANQLSRRVLPHTEPRGQTQSFLLKKLPLELRLLVWERILQRPYTTIERWRLPYDSGGALSPYGAAGLDADCFPYQLRTAMTDWDIKKREKPLALLLSCRQMYSEALKVLYSSTKFVLAKPADIHCFQEIASPEGLASVRSLIIPFGNVEWWFYKKDFLQEWKGAFCGLEKMPSLCELEIWLYHRQAEESVRERRPWEEKDSSEAAEQSHKELFKLFTTARVPKFTVNLTWNPEDLFWQQELPFKVNLQTYKECSRGISQFPYAVDDLDSLYN
ncbi:hypothetical protein K458DRAFT_490259 [Lentithecium fluviatile CBS 122367]|uniref:DUF7730 domain-containing protein n=1 Tax=Lentithecium fluviatile CBS 122367 TaxID=1168545 RepID=A0A6G1INK0_9PLEO|nr:hypothetical protein K458DRAFT_490259 [Lentithecium fluviatile CBS 122367]